MSVRLDNTDPIANSDFLLTIEGLQGYWTEFSGISVTYKRPTYNDGLSNVERTASGGTKKYETATLTKNFDPEKDKPILDWIKEREDGKPFDFTVRPVRKTGNQYFRGNAAWRITGARTASANPLSAINTNGGDETVKISFTFSYETATFR